MLQEQGKEMRSRHIKQFNSVPVVLKKEQFYGLNAFNDEELFFKNRIALRLFKLRGAHMRFEEFLQDLYEL
jgi:hypothetical protein